MGFFKNLIMKIIGKKLNSETGKITEVSRTKLVAVISVIIFAVPRISLAWGHPITIPPEIINILAAAGLWTLRDSIGK